MYSVKLERKTKPKFYTPRHKSCHQNK